jgi:hypothetical protein
MPTYRTLAFERDTVISDPEFDGYIEKTLPGAKIVKVDRWPDGRGANVTVEVPPTTLEIMDESMS